MTSIKHEKFVSEPLGDKPVAEVPGIEDVLGGRLNDRGFVKAYQLLEKYLTMGKNDAEFEDWLKKETGANKKQAGDCARALGEWYKNWSKEEATDSPKASGESIEHQERMTSIKHGKFVSEPLGDNSVKEVPGIGEVLGGRLNYRGFVKAYQLLEEYLRMGKNDTEFKNWLKKEFGAYENHATACTKALREWIEHQERMTSIKLGKFVSEPLGDKLVTEVPGIGEVLGGRLNYKGFVKAYQLLEEYVRMGKNDTEFKNWLKREIGAYENHATACTKALRECIEHQERMTSIKHGKFVSEPLGDKSVTEVPGIGEVLGGRLNYKGFVKAYQLLEEYVRMGKNDTAFKDWLKKEIGAYENHATACTKALREWIEHQERMTSIKHGKFVSEPLEDKLVTEVPGIDDVLGGVLKGKGFVKAYQLLQKYLTMGENDTEFKKWLKEEIGANEKQATDCIKAWGERTKHPARMASPSKKREYFLYAPVGDKSVEEIPGIGYTLRGKLEEKGFDQAYKLLGKYLIMGKNDTEFQNWLKREIGADQKEATDCSEALNEWCKIYMN